MNIFKKIRTLTLRLWLLSLFYYLSISGATGQIFHGKVVDQNFKPLEKAFITDTLSKATTTSNSIGEFELHLSESSVIEVSYLGYETSTRSFSTYSDTAVYFFQLKPDYQLIDEAVVSSDRIDKVVDKITSNVLDYVPYDEFIMTLEEYKTKRSIRLISSNEVLSEYSLEGIKAESLFEDCFGNIHVLSADSSYQIWIDNGLNFISVLSIEEFLEKIAPCVADTPLFSAFRKFTSHNKRYTLSQINKKTKERTILLETWDKEAEFLAREDYWEIIALYHSVMPPEANLIRNNAWDGNLVALAYNYDLMVLVGRYLKLSAQKTEMSAFQRGSEIIAFDLYRDSIYTFNSETNKSTVQKLNYHTKELDARIIQDKKSGELYLTTNDNGIYVLRTVNTTNGYTKKVLTLTESSYPECIQIYNGWLYFTAMEKNHHSLNRIKLEG